MWLANTSEMGKKGLHRGISLAAKHILSWQSKKLRNQPSGGKPCCHTGPTQSYYPLHNNKSSHTNKWEKQKMKQGLESTGENWRRICWQQTHANQGRTHLPQPKKGVCLSAVLPPQRSHSLCWMPHLALCDTLNQNPSDPHRGPLPGPKA